jgi:cell division protein FtsQ
MEILQPNALAAGRKRPRKKGGASARVVREPRTYRPQSILKLLLVSALLGAIGYAMFSTPKVVKSVSGQRVEHVNIEGDITHISKQDVLVAVNRYISESLLLVDMVQIKAELESMPWVRSVSIRREWPDTMVLNMVEEKAIARWGNAQLLNQDGRIFSPQSIVGLEQLAILSGPDGSERQVMEQYQLFNQLLYQRGLKIAEVTLNERGAWNLMLANGVDIHVGKDDVMSKMRRLVGFIDPEFLEQMPAIESIDLRYTSGIAVKNKALDSSKVVSL